MEALKNLDVWKRACHLSVDTYHITTACKNLIFKDQITRAALSVASNIAEGYERDSIPAKLQYLIIAKGSCGEMWAQLMIGRSAVFLNVSACKKLEQETAEISGMIWGLIKYYRQKKQTLATSP